MRERLERRLSELNREFEAGQKLFAELDAKRADLQATMLRITGAKQIIEELLASEPDPAVAAGTLQVAK